MQPLLLSDEPHSRPRWEVEWRILELTRSYWDNPALTPESRFVDTYDSLDMLEFIMQLEEDFQIRIDDAAPAFTRALTVRDLADWIIAERAKPHTRRPNPLPWIPRQPGDVPALPFTQLGGQPSRRDWEEGELYEPLGPNQEGRPQYRRRTDGMRCVLVPGAEVVLGSDDDDGRPDQRPRHEVTLSPFLIDAELVSNLAFSRFLNAVGDVGPETLSEWCNVAPGTHRAGQFPVTKGWFGWKPARGADQQPIVLISWYGANAYSLWANRRDWRHYRGDGSMPAALEQRRLNAAPPPSAWLHSCLPSEAQWEYAARAGQCGRYPWGDAAPEPARANVAAHRRGASYSAATLPAATVSARLGMSPFGLHHMAGNVWQWCRDWYAADFYRRPAALRPDAQNEEATGIRNERGGSWVGPALLAGSAYRRGRPPAVRGRCLGFRCAGLLEDLP